MTVTVAIVEDIAGTRESLVELFRLAPGIDCVGAYATGEEAVGGILERRPQVALVDINLPGMSGIECVKRLKRVYPALQILMLTTYEESDLIFTSLRSGANGYLLKNMPAEELIEAVKQVQDGGAPMSLQIARKVVAHFHRSDAGSGEMGKLSPRENDVLRLLAKGSLYKEIADQLAISMSTVRTHIHSIYEKLQVQTRTEAVVKYMNQT